MNHYTKWASFAPSRNRGSFSTDIVLHKQALKEMVENRKCILMCRFSVNNVRRSTKSNLSFPCHTIRFPSTKPQANSQSPRPKSFGLPTFVLLPSLLTHHLIFIINWQSLPCCLSLGKVMFRSQTNIYCYKEK